MTMQVNFAGQFQFHNDEDYRKALGHIEHFNVHHINNDKTRVILTGDNVLNHNFDGTLAYSYSA